MPKAIGVGATFLKWTFHLYWARNQGFNFIREYDHWRRDFGINFGWIPR